MLFYSNPLFNPLVTSFKGTISMSTNQSSIFSPETFLDATTTEESVKRPPMPAGREFPSTLKSVKSRAWQGKKDPTKGGIVVDVVHEFDLSAFPDVMTALGGIDRVTITDGIMLDLTEGGSIDYSPGKNSKLRKYRDATGLNVAGQPFSIRMLEGRMVKSMIGHRPNENDPQEVFDQVNSVAVYR
jgi:hypothetical protein